MKTSESLAEEYQDRIDSMDHNDDGEEGEYSTQLSVFLRLLESCTSGVAQHETTAILAVRRGADHACVIFRSLQTGGCGHWHAGHGGTRALLNQVTPFLAKVGTGWYASLVGRFH